MQDFQITGRVHKIGQTEVKGSKKNFHIRELVVCIDGRYPEYPVFQFMQDYCDLLDKVRIGDLVRVHFHISGREWNGRYFTSLQGWRIEVLQQDNQAKTQNTDNVEVNEANKKRDYFDGEMDDDLPF